MIRVAAIIAVLLLRLRHPRAEIRIRIDITTVEPA